MAFNRRVSCLRVTVEYSWFSPIFSRLTSPIRTRPLPVSSMRAFEPWPSVLASMWCTRIGLRRVWCKRRTRLWQKIKRASLVCQRTFHRITVSTISNGWQRTKSRQFQCHLITWSKRRKHTSWLEWSPTSWVKTWLTCKTWFVDEMNQMYICTGTLCTRHFNSVKQ